MVDFTTLHPFDFDKNLFNFLVCVLFFFFSEVQFNIMHVLSSTIGLVTLLLVSFFSIKNFKLVANNNCYAVHISSPTYACSGYEPRPQLFVDMCGDCNYLASAEW